MKINSFTMTLGFSILSTLAACTSDINQLGDEDDAAGGPSGSSGASSGRAPDRGGVGVSKDSRFFLPTGDPDNTTAPSVEVDSRGGTHVVYPAYAGGGAYYAYCAPGCSGAEQTEVVRFDTDGTVGAAMLALDADGHPRVLLGAYDKVHYATCEQDCGKTGNWRAGVVAEHGAEKDISGASFALDPQGRPRFLLHTYVAYLGIGQREPKTEWLACDAADCTQQDSWTASKIADQIFHRSTLRFDASGGAHLGLIARVETDSGPVDVGGYQFCAADCGNAQSWNGPGFGAAFTSELEAIAMKPSISLALTKAGAPRVLFLGRNDSGSKSLQYLQCDDNCTQDGTWAGSILSEDENIDEGLDLTLDAQDRPRGAFTLNFNVGMIRCDAADCANAEWSVDKVEAGDDMDPDRIFPYPGCNVGMWFLHSPSIAMAADGSARVGYQAQDVSGGTSRECVAGTDMTFARLAVLAPF